MSEASPCPVWETLPMERRRSVVLLLGRMALRQIRGVPVAGETSDDDRGVDAASERPCIGEDPAGASRAARGRLRPAVHGPADRTPPGIDAAAIRAGRPGLSSSSKSG